MQPSARSWNRSRVEWNGATLELWQHLALIEILFHHSNVRLPHHIERALSCLVVTPRLHGIHHANREEIRNVNWSSGLTVWDWLHGTLRHDIPQEEITFGVEGYEDPREVTLPRVLVMPFGRQVSHEGHEGHEA